MFGQARPYCSNISNYPITNFQLTQSALMLIALTTLVTAAAAVSYAGYATMAPASQLYGRTLTHAAIQARLR